MKVIKLALLITLIGGISSDVYGNTQSQPDPEGDQQAIQCDGPVPFRISTKGPEARSHNDEFYEHGVRTTGTYQTAKNNRGEHVHTRRRDQSHLLLVGDPGTGKSQFLRFAAALCPRSVLTTGVGTTSAGLTCAAVREGNGKEFALEAGALVLADKGVCCIDEFGCIRDQDRTTIHEAMEQQTLSVAKAGIVCKLNCRATIIAVMNPRNSIYDNQATLSVNTGLGTPLLSRFDLIFKLIDTSDAERDSNVTTYLLNRAIQGAGFDVIEAADTESKIPWNLEKLRAYVSIVKERFQPAMSDAAATLLERHYERCRGVNSTTIPITVRFLESLIRLSQAHARVMFRNIVTLDDAVAVLEIMQSSAFACGGFDGFNHSATLHYSDPMSIDYSTEADIDFLCHKYHTLKTYNMLNFMDDQSQRKAIGMLNDTGRLESSGWNDLDARFSSAANFEGTTLTQDHYGRSYFDPPSQKRSRRIQ